MSPSSVRRRVVVAFPVVDNQAQWATVLAVRARYDPLAATIPPHLTLVFPFEDDLSDAALREHVLKAASGIRHFSVTFCEITGHEGEYLFLNVKQGNDQIIRLHDALYSGPLATHLVRSYTFVPHVTIGRLPPGDLSAALDATAGLDVPVRAHVDAVSVYRVEPDGSRPVLFELPLRR
jgi:2'-5' RNA ligase